MRTSSSSYCLLAGRYSSLAEVTGRARSTSIAAERRRQEAKDFIALKLKWEADAKELAEIMRKEREKKINPLKKYSKTEIMLLGYFLQKHYRGKYGDYHIDGIMKGSDYFIDANHLKAFDAYLSRKP